MVRFDVWQRGTSFTASTGYTADRWTTNTSTETINITKSSDGMQVDVVTGNNYGGIIQKVEGLHKLRGKTVTMSYDIRGGQGSTGIVPANFRSYIVERVNGAWTEYHYSAILTTLSTSWQRFSATYTLGNNTASDAEDYLHCVFQQTTGNSSGCDFEIANVQLELGSVATDFEHRSYGEELALCQRYWQQSYEIGTQAGTATSAGCYQNRTGSSTSSMYRHITLPVGMRTSPTIKLYGTSSTTNTVGKWRGSGDTAISMSSSYPSHNSFNVNGNMNQSYTYLSGHWTADAEL